MPCEELHSCSPNSRLGPDFTFSVLDAATHVCIIEYLAFATHLICKIAHLGYRLARYKLYNLNVEKEGETSS